LIFNRTYQLRSRRGGMVSAGEILEELTERAADRRRKKRSGKLQGVQLELDFEQHFADQPATDGRDRPPLADLFPDADV